MPHILPARAAPLAIAGALALLSPFWACQWLLAGGAQHPKRHAQCTPSRGIRGARAASNFEDGLSVQDMLRLARQRRDADAGVQPGTRAPRARTARAEAECAPAASAGAPAVDEVAVLPCVFTGQMQPARGLGEEIKLRFFQKRYQKMWSYAQAQTGGAVAVRYQQGSYRRGEEVFALWPAAQSAHAGGGRVLLGLSLGLFVCSVITAHPFPLVRLLPQQPQEPQEPQERGGPGITVPDVAALHARLRGLATPRLQSSAVAALELRDRVALLGWLATGGGGGEGLEVPHGVVG